MNLITLELAAKAKLSSNSVCDQINKKQCFQFGHTCVDRINLLTLYVS
jgi:hypothetical protein